MIRVLFTRCANSNVILPMLRIPNRQNPLPPLYTGRNFQFRKFLPVYSNDLFAEGWEKLTK